MNAFMNALGIVFKIVVLIALYIGFGSSAWAHGTHGAHGSIPAGGYTVPVWYKGAGNKPYICLRDAYALRERGVISGPIAHGYQVLVDGTIVQIHNGCNPNVRIQRRQVLINRGSLTINRGHSYGETRIERLRRNRREIDEETRVLRSQRRQLEEVRRGVRTFKRLFGR